MMTLVRYFLNNKIAVNVFVLGLFFLGLISFKNIPKEGMPDIDLNQVQITTTYPGAAPEDVELNVTIPLEEEISEITGIDYIESVSADNMSSIFIQLDESYSKKEIEDTIQDIRVAVDTVNDLPPDVEDAPLVQELKTEDVPIIAGTDNGYVPPSSAVTEDVPSMATGSKGWVASTCELTTEPPSIPTNSRDRIRSG